MKPENFIVVQGWMRTELKLKGNDLLVYAVIFGFSQTDDQRFTGSLQYLADWCGSSKQGILKNLKNLLDMGLIGKEEKYINNVKVVEYYTTKFNGVLNLVAHPIKLSLTNNIDNNKNNKKEIPISKDIGSTKTNFQFGKSNKQPKESMWDKCINLIDDFARNNSELRTILIQALKQFIDNSKENGIPFYTNNFKGKLNSLKRLTDDHGYLDAKLAVQIVKQTIDKGWNDFYQLKTDGGSSKKQPATDMGYVSERADKNAKVYEKF